MSKRLFDASDESENELQLGNNKDYAKSYNNFRKKELLKKFKDRGFDVSDSDGSEDSSESSEEDEVLDPKFDQEFFKTLASLKSKDPTIYDKSTRFFSGLATEENDRSDDGEAGTSKQKAKKIKPVTLKDYERKIILERGGKFEDDSETEEGNEDERALSPTVVEEERRLKAEFRNVLNADDSEEEEFGGIFKKREKSKEEKNKEEEDFANWLAGKQDNIENEAKEKLQPLKSYWSSSKLPQSERFLRDYILNKGYADTDSSIIPTYDEIVGDNEPLSDDEQELEKQAEFEQKYNFRFEEPDSEFIKRYPRTIDNSVRRTDDKRKLKRQDQKQRKEQEKEQKMKELEIVKEMKRKEIEEKIQKLKMVTGNDEIGFRDEELEDDFDPEAHDRRMQEIFNEDYYEVDEGEEKPECPSDIDELRMEDWDNYDPQRGGGDFEDYEPHCEDGDFNMDCEYDPAAEKQKLQKELIDNTKGRRGRKGRKNPFMEMIQAEKPPFNPEDEKTYAEYIDEYYEMDYEDVIGDTPCRFRYVETVPNDFGLTIEEILLAKNKELNQWASLKKAVQIRPDHLEKKEQRLYKMKAKNEELKRKIFKSLYGEGSDDEDQTEDNPITTNAQLNGEPSTASLSENTIESTGTLSKKRKRKAQTAATAAPPTSSIEKAEESTNKTKVDELCDSLVVKRSEVTGKVATPVNTDATVASKKKKKRKKNKISANQITLNVNKIQKSATVNSAKTLTTEAKPIKKTNPFAVPNKQKLLNGVEKSSSVKKGSGGNKFSSKPNKFSIRKTMKVQTINANGNEVRISDERLKAYGINPRKFHKTKKYGKNQN